MTPERVMTRDHDADESGLIGKTIEDVEYHGDYDTPFAVILDDGTTMMVSTWFPDDTNTTTAADELAELTGRDRREFEPDAEMEIPQFEDQEIE